MSDARKPGSASRCFIKFEPGGQLVPGSSGEGHAALEWTPVPSKLSLGERDVHLWQVWLDAQTAHLWELERTLSPEERLRAQSFHFERDRSRFIAGRGSLRAILGAYLSVPPARIALAQGTHGKPRLAAPWHWSRLRFNLSHSEGLALCAVACGREVGVDLERARPMPDIEQIAARFFSATEQARLRSAVDGDPVTAFFRYWTGKEALLKARGEGLSESARQVEFRPTSPAIGFNPHQGVAWTSCELLPQPGFIGALVVEGRGWQLKGWNYEWKAGEKPGSEDFPTRRKRGPSGSGAA